jgi:hypothetical protein
MGGPILIRAREEQCRGAGPCSEPCPVTEEEMLKYYTNKEIEEMGKKKEAPGKEKLIEALSELTGKTRAIIHTARKFGVSGPAIYNWMKEYDIKFGDDGKVIIESKPEAKEEIQQAVGDGIKDDTAAIQAGAPIIPNVELTSEDAFEYTGKDFATDEIKVEGPKIIIAGQETKKISSRLAYEEHDIGDTLVQIDHRQELVSIGNGKDMTFEEAIAAAELILDILDHE